MTIPKNTICIWYDTEAEAAARFYAETFPDSEVLNLVVDDTITEMLENDKVPVDFTVTVPGAS